MRYGFVTPNFAACGDARVLAELAALAEQSGWDGFFVWDHLQWPGMEPAADPWMALAAMALATERIRLGPLVTPVPRRHPAKLAREIATLDALCSGRAVFGAGAGAKELPEYAAFGDEPDPRVRASMLDEGLALLDALLRGGSVEHAGRHYRVECDAFQPSPATPRVPFWVGATWPHRAPFRRAARWDGVVPITADFDAMLDADDLRHIVAFVREHRDAKDPFDVVQIGFTEDAGDAARVRECENAGATWWVESRVPWLSPLPAIRERIGSGPPRVA